MAEIIKRKIKRTFDDKDKIPQGVSQDMEDMKEKKQVMIGEPKSGKPNKRRMGVAYGIWSHNKDPYKHVQDFWHWKLAMLWR